MKTKIRKSKTSLASYRLFNLLNFLSENEASIKEIVCYLQNLDPENKTYSVITVYKYLNTLKTLGFEIEKDDKNKYKIVKIPFTLNFSKNSIWIIKYLDEYSKYLETKTLKNNLQKIISLLSSKFDKDSYKYYEEINISEIKLPRIYTDEEKLLIETFEQYIKDAQKLCITYREEKFLTKRITAEPVEIAYTENKVYFVVFDILKGQNIYIDIEKVEGFEQLPQKSRMNGYSTTVLFKIKDRLKRRYRLRPYEKVSDVSEDKMTIINQGEDKDKLIRRLIGYCNLCKLETPKSYQKDLIAELDAILKNYE